METHPRRSSPVRAEALYSAGEAFWLAADALNRARAHLHALDEMDDVADVQGLIAKVEACANRVEASADVEMEAISDGI